MDTSSLGAVVARSLLGLIAGIVFLFLVLPVLAILPLSLNSGQFLAYPLQGISLVWYQELLTDERWLIALRNSILIALSATAIATPLGVMAAFGLSLSDFPGKHLARAIMLAPLVTPVVIYAVGLYFIFAPLHLTGTFVGLILSHAVLGAPFVVITVSASLTTLDWNLVRAGSSLGANPLVVTRRIILPLLAPGVIFGALLAFAASLEEVVLVLIIGGPEQRTLTREMFVQLRENISPVLAAAAAVLIIFSISVLFAFELLRRRTERFRGSKLR